MTRNCLRMCCYLTFAFCSHQLFADRTIRITVKTNEKTAIGIGFSVEGKATGSLGKTYSGKGPVNKKYTFGYRKLSIHGANINCESHILTQDAIVTLVTEGDKCLSVIQD